MALFCRYCTWHWAGSHTDLVGMAEERRTWLNRYRRLILTSLYRCLFLHLMKHQLSKILSGGYPQHAGKPGSYRHRRRVHDGINEIVVKAFGNYRRVNWLTLEMAARHWPLTRECGSRRAVIIALDADTQFGLKRLQSWHAGLSIRSAPSLETPKSATG